MKKKIKTKDAGAPVRRAKLGVVISTAVLVLAALLCLFVTVEALTVGYTDLFGFSVFRVVTPSMEPTIPVNALLLSKRTPIGEIAAGDIICFRSLESETRGSVITHRVVSVGTDSSGGIILESRGDANYTSDAYFVREDNLIGRVVWYTEGQNFLTGFVSFISGRIGFMALIVIPLLIVAALLMRGVGKKLRADLKQTVEDIVDAEGKPGDELLPGYKTITKRDYEEIYARLKSELRKELYGSAEETEGKTEYPEREEK